MDIKMSVTQILTSKDTCYIMFRDNIQKSQAVSYIICINLLQS